jgi:Ni/Fe-hydrogenase subunit HybB-like protein
VPPAAVGQGARPALLFLSAALVVGGVAFNRVNVFLVAFRPLYATKPYFPSAGEIAITVAMISGLLLLYRVLITILPILPSEHEPGPRSADSRRIRPAPPAPIRTWTA